MSGFWQSLITTAAEVYEPRDGWGLAGLVTINLGGILTAAGTAVLLIRQRGVKKALDATNGQVINGHKEAPPLRVDIDDKHAELMAEVSGVKAVLTEHGRRLGSIEEHLRN